MSKVIRLTESDLVNIVKKVINEQNKISNDWSTNLKNSGKNANSCPAGFVQMTQQEISSYDKQLVKPWTNTTNGSDNFKLLQGGKVICKRVSSKASGEPVNVNPFEGYTLDEIVTGFRDAISGVGGTIAQIIIAGLGGHVVNMIAWGLLVTYDIYSWVSKGTADWFNILHDLFWLLLSGAGGKIMGGLKPLIKGESKLLTVFAKISKTTSWPYIKGVLTKIGTYGSKIMSKMSQAIKLIISKLPDLKTMLNPLLGVINRVGGVLKTIEETLIQYTKLSVKKGTTNYVKSDLLGQALNTTVGQLK